MRRAILLLVGVALMWRVARQPEHETDRSDDGRDADNGGDSPEPRIVIVERRPSGADSRPTGQDVRRGRRRLGSVLIAIGVVVLAYGAATVLWRDPITDLYTRWQQHQLASELEASIAAFQEDEAALVAQRAGAAQARAQADKDAINDALIAAAHRFDRRLKIGQPLGRLIVPRLNLNQVVIYGTRWRQDLSRGPGHYPETGIPAVGQTSAIAGHRTTFGAPFRYINNLERGNAITLELPYGTFHYSVIRHKIVDNGDWSIVEPLGFDALVLTACHPLYSAAQRWVVFARLSWVETMDGARIDVWEPTRAGSRA